MPGSSVGNNKTWLDQADRVILEVNSWQPRELEGFHDIYYGTPLPPYRRPIQLTHPMQRIGDPYLRVTPTRWSPWSRRRPRPQHAAQPARRGLHGDGRPLRGLPAPRGRGGRMPPDLLPLQCGVGNVANAVMAGLVDSEFERLTAFTEVIQDGMLDLLDSGKLRAASATSFGALAGAGSAASWPTSAPTRAASCCAARRSPTIPSWSAGSA